MAHALDDLILALGQKNQILGAEVPFRAFGELAIARLSTLIDCETSSARSVINGMHVIFALAREGHPKWFNALVAPAIRLSQSSDPALRASAATILVRLAVLADEFPNLDIAVPGRQELHDILNRSLALGINSDATLYIMAYLIEDLK